ncbi:MAG: hypothetical protein LBQ69_04905, partial [Treponema sp.]|nr:hypothetical protein [Treponema sp.]
MAREITAGVLLKLKDQFSSQIKGAGVSVQGFADTANKARQTHEAKMPCFYKKFVLKHFTRKCKNARFGAKFAKIT